MIVITVAIAILSSLPAIADIKRPETVRDTLVVLLEAIQSNKHTQTAHIDWTDNSIIFDLPHETDIRVFPDNLHHMLQGAKTDSERQRTLDTFIQNTIDRFINIQNGDNKTTDILPVVRHENYGKNIGETDPPLSLPFIADMRIFFAHDSETSLEYITSKDIKELGLTIEDLRFTAFENFSNKDWEVQIEGGGIYSLYLDGTNEASFLLDTDLWEEIDEQLGEIILIALSRDLVVFVDNTKIDGKSVLKGIQEKYFAKIAYPISDAILVWKNGRWEIFD